MEGKTLTKKELASSLEFNVIKDNLPFDKYPNVEDFDKHLQCENAYHMGQYKDFVFNGFSFAKAIKASKFRETTMSEFYPDGFHCDEGEEGTLYGVSCCLNLTTFKEDKHFAIEPKAKYWQITLFHECGHLFLEHNPIDFIAEMMGESVDFQESEAELFSYFCCKKIGYDTEFGLVSANLNSYAHHIGLLTNEQIDRVDKAAGAFIALGMVDK